MRFLVDECTGPAVAKWLRDQGYEVFSVFEEARGAKDNWLIQKARDDKSILITNDKDFGAKIYRDRVLHKGVVLLRLEDERTPVKIDVISKLIKRYGDRLSQNFVVVTERRVRFAAGNI
jgi:predicted nuclease of predicted toxin-antitoxin system